jgi:hypothetical protein
VVEADGDEKDHSADHKSADSKLLMPLDVYDKWGFGLMALMTAVAAGKLDCCARRSSFPHWPGPVMRRKIEVELSLHRRLRRVSLSVAGVVAARPSTVF